MERQAGRTTHERQAAEIQLELAFVAENKGEAPGAVGEGTVGEKNRHIKNHIPEIVPWLPDKSIGGKYFLKELLYERPHINTQVISQKLHGMRLHGDSVERP
jgi:hypothetical protein